MIKSVQNDSEKIFEFSRQKFEILLYFLGETYECIREDKGFKYVSEQVSHHPPVSVCHATSEKWSWWQDFRVKTKFWGKSMEFQPEGVINLMLVLPDGTKEYYTWNKVKKVTSIASLFFFKL